MDADLVVTHTPPRGHRDAGEDRSCATLRKTLWRVRPQLAVCGHIHSGWGAENVTWDLDDGEGNNQGRQVHTFDLDSAGKKLAKVDLTRKAKIWSFRSATSETGLALIDNGLDGRLQNSQHDDTLPIAVRNQPESMISEVSQKPRGNHKVRHRISAADNEEQETRPSSSTNRFDAGFHANPGRDDGLGVVEALSRTQTCIVNAAIMTQRRVGGPSGPKYNKPIIVDLDLPVWDDSREPTA